MSENFLDAATAPGDLPLSLILERISLLATQFRHDNTIDPLGPQPDEPVTVWATSGRQVPLVKAAVFYTTDGSQPSEKSASIPMTTDQVAYQPLAGYISQWRAILPPQPAGTVVRYRIGGWSSGADLDAAPDWYAQDGQGFWFRYGPEEGISTFAYLVAEDGPRHPAWLRDAVIYQIFLDRFHPGNEDGRFPEGLDPVSLHGGTLEGVRRSLPYLTELGVTCLWLSPIGPADTYHRYDQRDYFGIDPALGDEEKMRALVSEAHQRGIRVLLDFVPSHLSYRHPAFLAAQQDSSAPTYSWFSFDEWPHSYRSFMGSVPWLVSVNTADPSARQHIIDSALYWVDEFGVDGYRLDHAIGHGMDFWVAFRQALAARDPDVVTIGEATDTGDSLRRYRGRLTDILDFPLAAALRLSVGSGAWSVAELDAFLDAYDRFMAEGPGRVSFLDNHDMDRFLYVAGGDVNRLKLAALIQFALPHPPVIYYGTEIGMGQTLSMKDEGSGGDSIARQDMIWDPARWNYALREFYASLIHARRDKLALRAGQRERLHLRDTAATAVYLLASPEAGEPDVLLAFNMGESKRNVPLPSAGLTLLVTTDDAVTVEGDHLVLPPLSGAWLAAPE